VNLQDTASRTVAEGINGQLTLVVQDGPDERVLMEPLPQRSPIGQGQVTGNANAPIPISSLQRVTPANELMDPTL
jgi:hypothetical protein